MIEGLKQFFGRIQISQKEEPYRFSDEVNSIYNSGLLNNILTKEETLCFFKDTYQLIKEQLDRVYQQTDQSQITELDETFKIDYNKYYNSVQKFNINKDTLFNLLTQIYCNKLERTHLSEITEKYEDLVFKYYSLKQEYLMKLATEFEQNDKLKNRYEKQIRQLKGDQEEAILFLNKKRRMRSYLESKEFTRKQFLPENDNGIKIIDHNISPVLPNIFVNFNITQSLNQLKNVLNISNKQASEQVIQKIELSKDIIKQDIWKLDSIKGVENAENLEYNPISLISNSRINHEAFLQNLLNCERKIEMKYMDQQKIYQGDFVGFFDLKSINKNQNILILTTHGLDDTLNYSKIDGEFSDLSQLQFLTKDFKKISDDSSENSKKVNNITIYDKNELTQLKSVLYLMKKAIVCQFLIESSSTVYVMLQETDQDFALYEQIKLICSNFLNKNKKKEVNFIHFYPQIQDVNCLQALNQYQKIKSRFNLNDIYSPDFQNKQFIKYFENEEKQNSYRNELKNKKISYKHLMLFGDFKSAYNQQLFSQIKEDIQWTKKHDIHISEIETGMKECIFNSLKTFFQVSKDNLQFKEQPIKKRKTNENEYGCRPSRNDHIYWKDLILFPSCFLTASLIQEEEDNNNQQMK